VLNNETPYFIEEFVKTENSRLLLSLIGFVELLSEEDWLFPHQIDLETIENVERLNFRLLQTTINPKKLIKKSHNRTPALEPKEPKIRKEKKEEIKEVKIFLSEQFVLDSDEDEEADKRFFAKEAALRQRLNENNGVLKKTTEKPKLKKRTKKLSNKSDNSLTEGDEYSDGEAKGMDVDSDEDVQVSKSAINSDEDSSKKIMDSDDDATVSKSLVNSDAVDSDDDSKVLKMKKNTVDQDSEEDVKKVSKLKTSRVVDDESDDDIGMIEVSQPMKKKSRIIESDDDE
jgi:replication fork protection complex subunit Tof1/Swi1